MNELKMNDLIKPRNFCSISKFVDDLRFINYGAEFEINYCSIYSEKASLDKENIDRDKARFLDLDIKIRDRKFQIGLFDKRDSFSFSVVCIPDN